MSTLEFDFDPVDSITAGVEGEPGARTFFVEARRGPRACTLVVEKLQLQELGGQLLQLLDPSRDQPAPAPEPTTGPGDPPGWRVGNIQLALDEEAGQCTMILEEQRPLAEDEDEEDQDREPEEAEPGPELRAARLVASLEQVRGLAERALRVIEGGRAICPLCHLPIDAQGHVCPASNGHHRV